MCRVLWLCLQGCLKWLLNFSSTQFLSPFVLNFVPLPLLTRYFISYFHLSFPLKIFSPKLSDVAVKRRKICNFIYWIICVVFLFSLATRAGRSGQKLEHQRDSIRAFFSLLTDFDHPCSNHPRWDPRHSGRGGTATLHSPTNPLNRQFSLFSRIRGVESFRRA